MTNPFHNDELFDDWWETAKIYLSTILSDTQLNSVKTNAYNAWWQGYDSGYDDGCVAQNYS